MKTVLPIGFVLKDKVYRNFVLREIDARAEKVIHDSKFRSNHPQIWLARVVSCLLEELEGEKVA